MFTIDNNKLERQQQGVDKWRKNKGKGGLGWITSMGKTFTSVNLVIKPFLKKHPEAFICIVVHSVPLITTWLKNLQQFLPEDKLDQVVVKTVDKYVKENVIVECDLVVCDEVSSYYGPRTRGVWDGTLIHYKYILWLDATPEDRYGIYKELYKIAPKIDHIDTATALANGWINEFIVYNLGLEMNETEKTAYEDLTSEINSAMSYFNYSLSLAHKCLKGGEDTNDNSWTAYQYCCAIATKYGNWEANFEQISRNPKPLELTELQYKRILEICEKWSPNKVMGQARKVFDLIRKRKYLLCKGDTKLRMAINILERFKDLKTIAFSESTEFASNLYKVALASGINIVQYHSNVETRPLRADENGKPSLTGKGDYILYKSGKNKGKIKKFGKTTLNKLSLEAFYNGYADVLSSGAGLKKGLNDEAIQLGLVNSMTSVPGSWVQTRGRIIRIDPKKRNQVVLIIVLYYKDTKDEDWVRQAQYNHSSELHWVDSIEEITYNPGINIEDL